jgi:hypothetical protein
MSFMRSRKHSAGAGVHHPQRWLTFLGYAVVLVSLVAPDGHPAIVFLFPGWVHLVSVLLLLTRPVAARRLDREGPP